MPPKKSFCTPFELKTITMKTFRSLCTFFLLSSFLLTSTLCFAQTSYVWDGSSSTAWATAANWTPSGVPAGSDDVTIVSAGNNPILSGNASVKSLTITSGTLDLNGFTLSLNKNLILSGGSAEDGLIELNTGSQANLDNVILDCELNVTAATLNIDNCTFNQEVTFEKTGSGSDYLGGNKYLAQANFINNSYTLSGLMLGWNANDTIMAGLYLENHAKSFLLGHKSNGNKVVFAGSGNQQLEITGTYSVSAYRADVNKPSGELLLDGTLYVSKVLILTNGILEAENGLIYFNSGATVSGTSDSSYIDGAVEKRGNQAFTFPVGKNGHYRPISISAPSSTSSGFRAEYFEYDSDPIHAHSSKDGSIAEISRNEHWNLERTSGTSNVNVTLSWDSLSTSCGFDDKADLLVTAWNGSQWKNLGNGGVAGNDVKGTVITSAASTFYGLYTLATTDEFVCARGGSCSYATCNLVGNGDFETAINCGPIGQGSVSLNCWERLGWEPSAEVFVRGCTTGGGTYNVGTNTFGSSPPSDTHTTEHPMIISWAFMRILNGTFLIFP